jgi:hypothetical protein
MKRIIAVLAALLFSSVAAAQNPIKIGIPSRSA